MAAVWRAAGRGSGSGRNRPEPEASLTEGDGDPVEGTPGADGGALHEGLDVDGVEEGREDRWWENEWRVTPGGWLNGSSWYEWHGSDNWNYGSWRNNYVARIEETIWGRDGRWQGSLTHANSHESWHGTDNGGN